jgi:N-6 DNA Methylase
MHPDLRADFILTNPPFNVSEWGGERLRADQRWMYGVPPASNAKRGVSVATVTDHRRLGQAHASVIWPSMSSVSPISPDAARHRRCRPVHADGVPARCRWSLKVVSSHEAGQNNRELPPPTPDR